MVDSNNETTSNLKLAVDDLTQIVSRFDEIVNQKCSKFSLQQVEEQMKNFMVFSDFEMMKSGKVHLICRIQFKII